MDKCSSYRLEHFFADNFYACHYFGLIDLIGRYAKEEKKAIDKAKKKGKMGKKR